MSLEKFFRPSGINQPENLQNTFVKYVPYIIKSMYPQKMIDSLLDKY